jgi:acyl carrier protein
LPDLPRRGCDPRGPTQRVGAHVVPSLAQDVLRLQHTELRDTAAVRLMRHVVTTGIPARIAGAGIQERVVAAIARQLGVDEKALTLDTSIARDLFGDSLYAVEAIMALEDEFDLRISDEDAATITTVGRAIEHIMRELDSKDTESTPPAQNSTFTPA